MWSEVLCGGEKGSGGKERDVTPTGNVYFLIRLWRLCGTPDDSGSGGGLMAAISAGRILCPLFILSGFRSLFPR